MGKTWQGILLAILFAVVPAVGNAQEKSFVETVPTPDY
jgi:hypothetical protein